MTLRLALLASGLIFAAACDEGSSKDSEDNGDDGNGDDGNGDEGGDPGGPGDPGGDGGGPAGDGGPGGPGGEGGPGGDGGPGGGDGGGPGGDDGGGGVSWHGGYGLVLHDGSNVACNLIWWNTSGTGSSVTCAGCDYTYDINGVFDNSNCYKEDKGKNTAYTNAHAPDAYDYKGTLYDLMYLSYDDGAKWYFNGFVIDGGGGSGYVQYLVNTGDTYKGLYYGWFGYADYH